MFNKNMILWTIIGMTLGPVVGHAQEAPLPGSQPASASQPADALEASDPGFEPRLLSLPQMDSPTHFSPQEWVVLNAVRDRTREPFDPAMRLLVRKANPSAGLVIERDWVNAVPVTLTQLYAAPMEFRARLVRLTAQYMDSQKVEPPPAWGLDRPLYRLVCQDPATRLPIMVLSFDPPARDLYFKQPCTITGYFGKLWRYEVDPYDRDNGNPEATAIVIVGWVRAGAAAVPTTAAAALDQAPPPVGGGQSGEGSFGYALIMVLLLVGMYMFIRMRAGASGAGGFIGRGGPVPVQPRQTGVVNDPAYTEPINLDDFGRPPPNDSHKN